MTMSYFSGGNKIAQSAHTKIADRIKLKETQIYILELIMHELS